VVVVGCSGREEVEICRRDFDGEAVAVAHNCFLAV
jgi:hypothetical protein